MSALVWWLIPLLSTVVAVFWTAMLARRERVRSSEGLAGCPAGGDRRRPQGPR